MVSTGRRTVSIIIAGCAEELYGITRDEAKGLSARCIPWDRRQGTVGEVVCKDTESHRSTQL